MDEQFKGLTEDQVNGLLGEISKMPPSQLKAQLTDKVNAIKKHVGKRSGGGIIETTNLSVRELLKARLNEIQDPNIRQGIADKTLTAIDHTIYMIRAAGANNTIEVFQKSDRKSYTDLSVLTNLNSATLNGNEVFLITSIVLLYGEILTADLATSGKGAGSVDWRKFSPKFATYDGSTAMQLYNGIFSLSTSQKVLIDDMTTSVFDHSRADLSDREYKLEFPRLIQANGDVKLDIKMPSPIVPTTNYTGFVKVLLKGAITAKA